MISILFLFLLSANLLDAWLVVDLKVNQTNRLDEHYRRAMYRDAGEPLILTPYIEQGKIDEARLESFVQPLIDGVLSYSGFFTVNKEHNSNLFFWYFPSEVSPDTAPVYIWLQGGPGASSLYGLFNENGPYVMEDNNVIRKRDIYWSKEMNVIYVDSPVGAGYSFTDSEDGYVENEVDVGQQLYTFLQQFFTMFPELRSNEFYVGGESYGGKYIPALSYAIHTNNPTARYKINLKGLAIGNGMVDPINQMDYGNYLYGIGLIDDAQKELFEVQQNFVKEALQEGYLKEAYLSYNLLLGGKGSLFYNTTGFEYVYNYLISYDKPFDSRYITYLDSVASRKALHVGSLKYDLISSDVHIHLTGDYLDTVAPWLAELANNYKVMLYHGELDIILPYPLTLNYLRKLEWCGKEELLSGERDQWRVDGELAGYIKTSAPDDCNGSIRLVLVRDASHMVPTDQPKWAYSLIKDFISAKK